MFADYIPHVAGAPHQPLPRDLRIREPGSDDAHGMAMLMAEREGIGFEEALDRTRRGLKTDAERAGLVLVAEASEALVGYARARHMPDAEVSACDVPGGWYLMGIIIAAPFRRRGIGAELTRLRLNWLAGRAAETHYFCNSLNLPSIDLHRRFGFVEVRRGIRFPAAQFSGGGVGVLFTVKHAFQAPVQG
jgi:ribosomal protein S18 acetylase RimI-like enzyme